MAITLRNRVVVGILLVSGAAAVLALMIYGVIVLTTTEPQTPDYVGGTRSAPVFGYRSCGDDSIRTLTVYAVQGERRDLIWSVRATSPPVPRILQVRLGDVPVGFEQTHTLPAAHHWDRLAFSVVTTSGSPVGRAFDLSQLRAGYVIWAGGYARGENLDAVADSEFGC